MSSNNREWNKRETMRRSEKYLNGWQEEKKKKYLN